MNRPTLRRKVHWSPNVKLTEHFDLDEFACHDGAPVPSEYMPNVTKLAQALEVLRAYLGKPITIASGYRTKAWNDAHGGAEHSQHMTASAADLVIAGTGPAATKAALEQLIKDGKIPQGGIGLYTSFCHYDVRGTAARWNG